MTLSTRGQKGDYPWRPLIFPPIKKRLSDRCTWLTTSSCARSRLFPIGRRRHDRDAPPAGDQDDCVPITSHRAVRWPRPDAPLALPPRISAAMVPAQVSLPPGEACTLRQRHSGGRRHSGTRTPPLSRPIDAPQTRTPSCVRHRRNASASRRGERQMAVCTIGIPAK